MGNSAPDRARGEPEPHAHGAIESPGRELLIHRRDHEIENFDIALIALALLDRGSRRGDDVDLRPAAADVGIDAAGGAGNEQLGPALADEIAPADRDVAALGEGAVDPGGDRGAPARAGKRKDRA